MRRARLSALFVFPCALLASAGCGTSSHEAGADAGVDTGASTGDDGGGDDATDEPPAPAAPFTVSPFNKTLFAFNGAPGGVRRTTASAMLPTNATYQSISLHVQLDCPTGGCDHWDRTGSLGIVTEAPVDGGSHGTVVEMARWITPFGVKTAWDIDVTDLAPLLQGNVTLQGFVDTWSPQGNPAANGAGWLLTTTLTFTPGTPAKTPIAAIPLWSWAADSDPQSVPFGDPAKPVAMYLTPQTITLPAGATSYSVRTFATGHGQGNTENCAEFCKSTHSVTVGATSFMHTPWRTCCTPDPACEQQPNPMPAKGVTPGQLGTYMYPRSGWCPGAWVDAWTQDVTTAVSGSTASITYSLGPYTNFCRDEFADAGCMMGECTNSTGTCAYNGGDHTEPQFYITSVLIAYQ